MNLKLWKTVVNGIDERNSCGESPLCYIKTALEKAGVPELARSAWWRTLYLLHGEDSWLRDLVENLRVRVRRRAPCAEKERRGEQTSYKKRVRSQARDRKGEGCESEREGGMARQERMRENESERARRGASVPTCHIGYDIHADPGGIKSSDVTGAHMKVVPESTMLEDGSSERESGSPL